ncbi:Phosphoribosyl-ATP pyrophosphohydrolase [Orpheovirus IHUMI-LCC2]|uniref:Phosphoribosyl-ATP pyrophosphohydrolase n=1 Tax=Orpheovirus IHUMI-LCC2 TaxID=2023057 RepID=A0A2I2L4I7_9VIRU|nr:Phosphoribosyl-ATP pyrophosphohydrolase [Orpheovirus IHUMI-LCC2]SNW62448.1 Phosphoribosyl-ATP pyrophosphohydrolase [Orpheovirus IHUMI-LCC2]
MSHSLKVKEFTEGSTGKQCPKTPQLMSKNEVGFLFSMVKSEMVELAQTVCDSSEEAVQLFNNANCRDVNNNYSKPSLESELISEQADAMVDAWYYMLNAAAKKGMNLDRIFDVVHDANMSKRFSDGTFHRREDGKVIKPDGWKEPDTHGEIQRQLQHGSWN